MKHHMKSNQLMNRTLVEFEDLEPIVSSYLREVRNKQREIGA